MEVLVNTPIIPDSARKRNKTTKKYLRLQRRMDVSNLNGIVRVLKRFGTHDDLAAASLALWCIAAPAREKALEVGQ